MRWKLLILIGLVIIPMVYADKITTNPEENWVQYENYNFIYRMPEQNDGNYKYIHLPIEFWTTYDKQCIPYSDFFIPVGFNQSFDLQFNVEDTSYVQDNLYECSSTDDYINLTEYFCIVPDDVCEIPKDYNTKKYYCIEEVGIIPEEYQNHLNSEYCVEKGNNSLDTYFIAPEGTSGKFDFCVTLGLTEYCIDPYWNSSNTTFDGTFSNTQLNVQGYIELNNTNLTGSYNDTELFGGTAEVNNITYLIDSPYNFAELPDNNGADSGDYVNPFSSNDNRITYHLNSDDVSNVSDSSGNNLYGAFYVTAHINETHLFGDGSLQLDGDSDYVGISTGAITSGDTGTTISYWFYDDNWTDATAWHLSINKDGTDDIRSWHDNAAGFRLIAQFDSGGADPPTCVTNPTFTAGTWHYHTYTWDGSALRQYVDGKLTCTDSVHSGFSYFNPISITLGKRAFGTASYYNGNIDEFAIWNRTLTSTEIEQLFLRGSTLNLSLRTDGNFEIIGTSPYIFTALNNYTQSDFLSNFSNNGRNTSFSPKLWNFSILYTLEEENTTNNFRLNIEDYGMEWVKLNWTMS